MTIIAAHGDTMAADSASFQNDLMFPVVEPKIVRVPNDGGLIGATGATGDCCILRRWVRAGMDFEKPPKFSYPTPNEEHSLLWLWLKPDMTVHMGDSVVNVWQVPSPTIIGYGSQYVHGLLDAGVSLPEAVKMVIARFPYLGGEVQVEQLPSEDKKWGLLLEEVRLSKRDWMGA